MEAVESVVGKTVPQASHYCASNLCKFGVSTACKSHVVSSVGGMEGGREVGYNRTHETYVFKWDGRYCDCGCGVFVPSDLCEVDSLPANSDSECAANHVALVLKWLNV